MLCSRTQELETKTGDIEQLAKQPAPMEDLQERGRAAAILEGVGYLGPEEAEGKHKKNVEVTVQVSDPAVRCRPTSRVSAHVVVKMKMSVVAFLSLLFGRRCRVV